MDNIMEKLIAKLRLMTYGEQRNIAKYPNIS